MQEFNLNELEISAISEIANISMGNAATSISLLVQREVNISTPKLAICDNGSSIDAAADKQVVASVDYVKGIMGRNMLFLLEDEAKMMADFMMGSDGHGMFFDMEFSDMHLSAISEVMNQAMGAAATAMGLMLDRVVDISTPDARKIEAGQSISFDSNKDTRFVQVTFEVYIGDSMTLRMAQAFPFLLAKAIADIFLIKKGTMDK